MFDKFKGIKAEREVKEKEKSKVERLLQLGDAFVKEYEGPGLMFKVYKEMHDTLRGLKVEFDEDDLRNFIYAAHVNNYTGSERITLGAYSGCLLQLLTERNKAKGKGTRFYIDGRGISFPNLFAFTKEVDELIVENFKGNNIGSFIGSDNGYVNLLVGKNIEGEHLFSSAANKGRASIVVGVNVKGTGTLFGIGKKSLTGVIIGSNIEGDKTFGNVGEQGSTGAIIGTDLKGVYPFYEAGANGDVGMMLCNRFKGTHAFPMVGSTPNISLVMAKDLEQNNYYSFFSKGIKTALYENIVGDNPLMAFDAKKICAEESREEYDRLLKEYKLDEILKLADMKDKSIEEIIKDARKIRELYKSVEDKIKNA